MRERELADQIAAIPALDEASARAVQARLDAKTKPRGSLGRLEELARRLAAMQGSDRPVAGPRAIVVMAGDHGVAASPDGPVSAYPPEVTAQMVANFASGGAAINVLARAAGATVEVVDMGVRTPVDAPGIESVRVAPGTRDLTREPAMTREQALKAIAAGMTVATRLATRGVRLVGIGEMGIGNTTAASALACAFLDASAEEATGRGTGIDDATFARKVAAVSTALARHRAVIASGDALDIVAALSGFEIAGLAGVVIGAARHRVPVVVDGFISSVAALAATRIAPRAADYLLPSHRSVEVGHRLVLRELRLEPLFDFGLRLGEGTGAALAMQTIASAVHILDEMATFERAGVTDTGR
jgi:nicotinate-nucleotide--dimethylbenzimidazole phosphoribosyltransferase